MNEERLFINDNEIDLPIGQPIARTLQINDIGRLSDRQTNFTRTINISKTPKNMIAMDFLGTMGNTSNIPYQKNVANYFVGNECLIYNGWAKINQSTELSDTYEVNVYDGIIDFFKAIENKVITDADVSLLNHTKTIDNIKHSWTGNTDYRYMVADYNGKNTYTPTGTTENIVNVDYLIPSANVKFIWDRIFDFYGFTYSGSVFNSQKFLNLWLTYPKPTPTLVPNKVLINTQHCYPSGYTVHYYEGMALLEREQPIVSILRDNFTNPYLVVSGVGLTTTTTIGDVIPNPTWIDVVQNGTYAIDCQTSYEDIAYLVKDVSDSIIESGYLLPTIEPSGTTVGRIINCLAGYKIYIYNSPTVNYSAEFDFTITRVDGFKVDFEAVFLNFKITDFINEILQRFSLTMFPDKYSNNLTFLTTEEWLKTTDVIDWSDKNPKLLNTKYALSDYCQNNRFKYKYNDDNANYNDGLITINNLNIPDEKTVIQSIIYTPEREMVTMFDFPSHVYKFWNKEVKDDGSINYKPLDNRFYFLRSEDHTFNVPVTLGSETLNTTGSTSFCKVESYSRLRFQDIISDYYAPINSILNKAKIHSVEMYLTPKDINDFDFKKLIYLEQFGSYFLVNKINNYVPEKNTKVDLIQVDYEPTVSNYIPNPEPNPVSILNIDSIVVSGCNITLTYSTDANVGTEINIVGQPNTFGVPSFEPIDPIYLYNATVTNSGATGNTVSFTLEAGGFYQFQLIINGVGVENIYSNVVAFENVAICIINSPSGITITDVTLLSNNMLSNTYSVAFTSDAVLPRTIYFSDYITSSGIFGGWSTYQGVSVTTSPMIIEVGTLFGTPTKLKLKIGNTISNEYTIT